MTVFSLCVLWNNEPDINKTKLFLVQKLPFSDTTILEKPTRGQENNITSV